MKDISIREPDQIREACAKKLLRVIRGPKLRAVLGHLLGETWAVPTIAHLRLTADGCVIALTNGEYVEVAARATVIRAVHNISRAAGLDGDELGYMLGRVARIKRTK